MSRDLFNVAKFTSKICFLFLLISCSQNRAPIIDRGSLSYNRSYYEKNKNNILNKNRINNALGKTSKVIIVASGDSLRGIAKKHNISVRDLIASNDLKPPYIIKIGDKINIPQSQYHKVLEGETLYGISRKYGMNINTLIANNGLQKPYGLKVGDLLRVDNLGQQNSKISVAYSQKNTKKDLIDNKENSAKKEILKEKLKDNLKVAKIVPAALPEAKISSKNNQFIWPVKGVVISKFGAKPGGLYNDGINIKAENGAKVAVVEDGVVAYVGNELRGYGNLVIVKHSSGWISAYGHLEKATVKRGAKVLKGEEIAKVGTTGNVKSSQLYFALRKGRDAVNPQLYL